MKEACTAGVATCGGGRKALISARIRDSPGVVLTPRIPLRKRF